MPNDQPAPGQEPTRVLITGATGNIGMKLRAHLGAQGRYDLTLLCLNPKNDPEVITADLSHWDESWARHFAGIDTRAARGRRSQSDGVGGVGSRRSISTSCSTSWQRRSSTACAASSLPVPTSSSPATASQSCR